MPIIRNRAPVALNSVLGRELPPGDSEVTDGEAALLDGSLYFAVVPDHDPAADGTAPADTPDTPDPAAPADTPQESD